jgi:hypothetical protein
MFSELLRIFTEDLTSAVAGSYGAVLGALQPLLLASMALLILHYCHDAWAHGVQADRLLTFCRHLFVLSYAATPQAAGWLLDALQIPSYVSRSLFGGGGAANSAAVLDSAYMALYGRMDAIDVKFNFDACLPTAGMFLGVETDPCGFVGLDEWILAFVVLAFFAAYCLILLYLLTLAAFYTAAVVGLLPYAVALYSWDYTRPVFHGLVRQGISFALIPPLLYLLLSATLTPMLALLQSSESVTLAGTMAAVLALLMSSLLSLKLPAVAAGVAGGMGMPLISWRLR